MNLPQPILISTELFQELDAELLGLLRSLNDGDWSRATVCSEWTVKDIAAHLLDGSIRRLSSQRDGYLSPEAPNGFESHACLMDYLNNLNAAWTKAARRISPAILIHLLEITGTEYSEFIGTLDPFGPAIFSVAWAGEDRSQNWMDVAREYTEKWHHQQQIAEAVGRSGRILSRHLYFPVLDTFMRALPFTFWNTSAEEGTLVQVRVSGPAGGDWFLLRDAGNWNLGYEAEGSPDALVTLDHDVAWRVFTKRMNAQSALSKFPSIKIEGDHALGRVVLEMVSIMA
jgi:mycothiol maleylpyruvate isomerase-like protein